MADPLETIQTLTGCSEEDAKRVYEETKDLVEAVDRLLEKRQSAADKYIQSKKRKREVTEEEKVIAPYRAVLKEFDNRMSTSLSQHGHEGSVEKLHHPEEMVLQNNCSQQCQIPSLEEEVQIPEIVCPLPSECSYDLPSNDQTLQDFHQE